VENIMTQTQTDGLSAQSPLPAELVQLPPRLQAELARIDEFVQTMSQENDSFDAATGFLAGRLLRLHALAGHALQTDLQSGVNSTADLIPYLPAIDCLLNISKLAHGVGKFLDKRQACRERRKSIDVDQVKSFVSPRMAAGIEIEAADIVN
jgi:hypothetical protein